MDLNKTIGWAIFLIGIFIILFTVYSTYNIFTGEIDVPQLINFDASQSKPSMESATGFDANQINQMLSEQLGNLLPLDALPKVLNFIVWTMGAGVFIFGGFKISELGIKLIKQ